MAKTLIACAQIDCEIGRVAENRKLVVTQIREAAERGAQLIIFPECALTGYAFESLEEAAPLAETLDGESAEVIARACEETGTHAVVGFIEGEGQKLYNAAMLVGPSGVVGGYRKVHIPFIGLDRFVTPGDQPFRIFDLPFGRVGINICYDVSFPEAARMLKLLGAELILLPTNWPPGARPTCDFVVRTRAMENHINFAACDRVGTERGWSFIGRSKVVDFGGNVLAEASAENPELLFAEVDMAEANNNHIVHAPGAYEIDRLKDRRPEFYDLISKERT